MPELPEVETVIRTIRPHIWGCQVQVMICAGSGKLPNVAPSAIHGQTIRHIGRRGKYIIFHLDKGYLISHLRMTGQWLFSPVPPYKDSAFRWAFSMRDLEGNSSGYLWFRDPRKFGTLDWVASLDDYEPFSRLGVDGLELDRAKEVFKVVLRAKKTRRPIKNFLLDQSIIAGIGNIYASEALFEVGVDPTTKTCDLSEAQLWDICQSVRDIFLRAIDLGGSSVSDYIGGRYHEVLRVYKRDGEPCDGCGTTIKQITQAGRSTFFCPKCQGVGNEVS